MVFVAWDSFRVDGVLLQYFTVFDGVFRFLVRGR